MLLNENPTDVTPHGSVLSLVSEPKDGVDTMNKVTKNKPNDDRCGGNAVMVGLCRKNQDEEKGREEGKNRELDAHGAGEFLKEPTLKTECKESMRAFITRISRVSNPAC